MLGKLSRIPVCNSSIRTLDRFLDENTHSKDKIAIAKGIQTGMSRFNYGCDENLKLRIWRRYPHQVVDTMNCEDRGAFAFFAAARAGLDVSLVKLNGYMDLDSTHSAVLLRTSRKNILFDSYHFITCPNDLTQPGKIDQMNFKEGKLFSMNEVVDKLDSSRDHENIIDFLRNGQTFSSNCFPYQKDNGRSLILKSFRHLRMTESGLERIKTIELPGMYMSFVRRPNEVDFFISKGYNNGRLIFPILIARADEPVKKLCDFSFMPAGYQLQYTLTHLFHTGFFLDNQKIEEHVLKTIPEELVTLMNFPKWPLDQKHMELTLMMASDYSAKWLRFNKEKPSIVYPYYRVRTIDRGLIYFMNLATTCEVKTEKGKYQRELVNAAEFLTRV